MRTTLNAIESALRSSWDDDTTFASPEYLARGDGRASRGQCGPTALVVQELLGGDLVVADVEHAGRRNGVHYWNVTAAGVELDLTADQFTPDERLVDPRRVTGRRNVDSPGERAFGLLRDRVAAVLRRPAAPGSTSTRARPRVVCLCGSLRFPDQFTAERRRLTARGVVVLSPEDVEGELTPARRRDLGELHLRRIDLADEVRVVGARGAEGEATRREIAYARERGLVVSWSDFDG
ncbi:hypothetical protein ACFEMC_20545 [Kineococcus sp. DHX-1]|uniref:YunG family protein n=1 Tax=Kineococcus sp. DHX-1 TaxID=3349638 RepID=UPI0036D24998